MADRYKLEKFTRIQEMRVQFVRQNKLNVYDAGETTNRLYEMLAYDGPNATPMSQIEYNTRIYSAIPDNSTLFISPDSKIPRDCVRQSHTMTRDPMKANYYVIPDKIHMFYSISYHWLLKVEISDEVCIVPVCFDSMIARAGSLRAQNIDPDNLRTYIAQRVSEGAAVPTVTVLDAVEDDAMFDYAKRQSLYKKAYLLPKVEEYYSILQGKVPHKFVFDHDVTFTNDAKITPEGLYIMFHNKDKNTVLRSLAAMDWKEYPITVTTFIYSYQDDYISTYSIPGSARYMVDSLGCFLRRTWAEANRALQNTLVSSKDAQMLQDWILRELEIEEGSGYVDLNKYAKLPAPMQGFLRKKLAVAKVKCDQRIMYKDL